MNVKDRKRNALNWKPKKISKTSNLNLTKNPKKTRRIKTIAIKKKKLKRRLENQSAKKKQLS